MTDPERPHEAPEENRLDEEQKTADETDASTADASSDLETPTAEEASFATEPAPRGRVSLRGRFVELVLFILAVVGWGLAYQQYMQVIEAREQLARVRLTDRDVLVVAEPDTKHVTSIHLRGQKIDQEILADLAALYCLGSAHLGKTDIVDDQLASLKGMSNLASLVLSETAITDAGLSHLQSLPNLEVLHLPHTQVTDKGLATLGRFPKLAVLDISDTQVTDKGLARLQGLDGLRWLLVANTDITDTGLEHIQTLKGLKRVTLTGTKVTADGIAKLTKAIPDISVDAPAAEPQ